MSKGARAEVGTTIEYLAVAERGGGAGDETNEIIVHDTPEADRR